MRQMKSRTIHLGILAAVVFFLMLVPNAIRTYAQEYGLWVEGVQVTDDNKDNILGKIDYSYTYKPTASYDPETCTLTLHAGWINAAGSAYPYFKTGISADSVHSLKDLANNLFPIKRFEDIRLGTIAHGFLDKAKTVMAC